MSEGGTRYRNSEKISRPLVTLRKDRQGTQKTEAEQLHISDKGIQRGASKTLIDIGFASEIYVLYKMSADEFLYGKLESDGKAEKSKTAFLTRLSNSFLRRKNFLNKAV